ncbi:MAG: acetyl-CoA acetyltransferase [Acidimicrobiales bacterium]
MSSHGIKDRVAIVGMSCTPFREHFNRSRDDLLIDAADEVLAAVGVTKQDIDAYWMGMAVSGSSGIVLASALKLQGKPVTRVENYCATGSEALRQAAYAVASGAYDIAMAIGCDKFKDTGFAGTNANNKYGVDRSELRMAVAKIAEKNHYNGARNPRAQFRKETSAEDICKMAAVAGELSVFDCAGVADGAAAAIVVRAEDAHRYTDKPVFIKGMSVVAGDGSGLVDPSYDFTTFPEVVAAAEDAYQQAGVDDPRSQVAMAEVHDCFTPTELVLMEDLRFAERGTAWKEVLAGTFALDGSLPVNTDGGLKSFGHPVGASGLRMHYECFLQLRGEAPENRRIANDRKLAVVHNLGGYPGEMVSFVSVVGTEPG